MIVVMNRIPVAPGFGDTFKERFHKRAELIDHEPGFIRNEILRPLQSDYYIVKTYGRSREDVERWMHSESFRQAHANRPSAAMCTGPSVFGNSRSRATSRRGCDYRTWSGPSVSV